MRLNFIVNVLKLHHLNYEFEIEFVELDSGNIPFIRFLDSLSKTEKAEKTPNDEIEKAIRYKNIYLNR